MIHAEETLAISFIDNGLVEGSFSFSLANSIIKLREEVKITHLIRWSSSSIVMNRYKTLTDFVDNTDADWLLCIDTDIVFTAEDLSKLWADRSLERQVITGVYFLLYGNTPLVPYAYPSIYTRAENEKDGEATTVHPLPENEIIKISRAGFGFILLSRQAVEKVLGKEQINPFINRGLETQHIVGEDFVFFEHLEKSGIDAYCDTGVILSHQKSIPINKNYYEFFWNLVEPRLGM